MKASFPTRINSLIVALFCASLVLGLTSSAFSRDTDIYNVNARQNAYVLMDSSDSMAFGVYEHDINYADMYDYLFTLNDNPAGDYQDYIWDNIVKSDVIYKNKQVRNKIYLLKGNIGVSIANVDGKNIAFTGDAADPKYLWKAENIIDTHTVIDGNGNLQSDLSGNTQRITVDAGGYVRFDGNPLPLGMDIKVHDFVTFYNGTVVDNGFSGMMTAPGFYFSGYSCPPSPAPPTSIVEAKHGDSDIWFFVTGNWINMQAMYNLQYMSNPKLGEMAWIYEQFPIPSSSWPQSSISLKYPAGTGNYSKNLEEKDTAQTIVQAGAKFIQIHFSSFDVPGDNSSTKWNKDYVKLYDQKGDIIASYDNDNKPTATNGGWSPIITGDTAILKLHSDNSIEGTGYAIDKVRVVYFISPSGDPAYLMQNRLDVAKEAMIYVVEEFRGKMNWGYASFANGSDGATFGPMLNPTETDDNQRASIVTHIKNVTPQGGTPLMEALQDVWLKGYNGKVNALSKLLCRKNYVISMTDGYPSLDDDKERIKGPGLTTITFDDWDNDKWTQDPYQKMGHLPDYYDDVAHWMYTHSYIDQSEVTDPANSYVNVITHHIAFGAKHPLLEDAAGESGGEYIVAYNKEQLIAAFYSLALMMSEAVSFTAPVVSVDAVNKIQSGEDLYMGLFFPQESKLWAGNLKKFKVGDGTSTNRPKRFMIYDRNNHEAINSAGEFLDNTAGFWGDDLDPNDTDTYGAADIQEDGAGEVLLEAVQSYFANPTMYPYTYWNRPIFTWKDDGSGTKKMVRFNRTNITALDLGVPDNATRDKLINFTHGYTYDADAATGAPLAVREWVLGSIIHSRPVVVDYFITTDPKLPLDRRYIVVGSNDGMLHVFDDDTGRELFAFIPTDILPQLKNVQANDLYDTVDGLITLYRRNNNPKYLIFGERRGGSHFWNLDISNKEPLQWTVKWDYTNTEIAQSWSEVKVATIPVAISTSGQKTYKDVAIFTGGYDPEEDNYPEPFTDQDGNGTPFSSPGNIDNKEWSKATHDINGNGVYDQYNPDMNEKGRGIYIVDIDDPTAVTTVTEYNELTATTASKNVLPFSVTYGAAPVTTGTTQKLPQMKFSFPANPTVATGTDTYIYKTATGLTEGPQPNVLLAAYAVDVYANLYKIRFNFELKNYDTTTSPDWKTTSAGWKVDNIFNGNPGSTSTRAGSTPSLPNSSDQGRKAFYPPAISWGGSKGYFEAGNYYFPNVTFETENRMASLFFGTGDRENPKYTMIRNRFYAIYDDISVSAILQPDVGPATNVAISSSPYSEVNLLNLTCDELGQDSVISSCYLGALGGACNPADSTSADVDMKKYLRSLLTDDAVYNEPPALENGVAHENDKKGWYIVLADQGKTCGHMSYPTVIDNTDGTDHDNHYGEQILSQPVLYFNTLYFTSYQPATVDTCNPQGNGFAYALNYLDGSATYDLNDPTSQKQDITDRYKKFTGITGIPSGFTIITSGGHAAAMASMGGAIIGPGPDPNNPYAIATPGLGLELFYWRDSNSR